MKKTDVALKFSNPRILSAAYFGLLSVAGTMLINGLLTILGFENIVPLYMAVFLGMFIASCTGAIFGQRIIYSTPPYKLKTFCIGFFMVLISLPAFDLGILLLMDNSNTFFAEILKTRGIIFSFFFILFYSYVLFGFLLAVCSGFAAMYLRERMVYDILHTNSEGELKITVEKPKPKAKKKKALPTRSIDKSHVPKIQV